MARDKRISKQKMISAIVQTSMILILIVVVAIMMLLINHLQGTARVINYAGLVRGATQREVKLEIAERPNNELITYLDNILSGLKYGKGSYDLVSLDDQEYQSNLDVQMEYWEKLKDEIKKVRSDGYQNTDIVDMSETYFGLADQTVSAAETYSEKIAQNLSILEIVSAIDMVFLILMIIYRTVFSIKITKMNRQLEKKAYLDVHTGLANKSCCEKFLNNDQFISEATAVIVYDLNNLKTVNDTLGHVVGDQFILNFSRLLRDSVPTHDFVGRYGGDEFMAIVHNASAEKINEISEKLAEEVNHFNKLHHGRNNVDINYAYGWALSTDYRQCTFRTLFDKADKNMYQNKMQSKNARRG